MARLTDQRALVTGASSGIGREIARRLAAEGAALVLTARRADRLEALATELRDTHGIEVVVVVADLGDPAAPALIYEQTEGANLPVDILVNNAGFGVYEDFVDADWARYEAMLQVNVIALTALCRHFVPALIARGRGRVMNVASIGAYMPCPTFAVYAATKAYVRNFTEALNFELRGTGVTATAVCPGGTRTEFLEKGNQTLKASGEKWMMTAETCAAIAVEKTLAGRAVVVTGFVNALTMWLIRFLPRAWIPWAAHVTMSGAVEKTNG